MSNNAKLKVAIITETSDRSILKIKELFPSAEKGCKYDLYKTDNFLIYPFGLISLRNGFFNGHRFNKVYVSKRLMILDLIDHILQAVQGDFEKIEYID